MFKKRIVVELGIPASCNLEDEQKYVAKAVNNFKAAGFRAVVIPNRELTQSKIVIHYAEK